MQEKWFRIRVSRLGLWLVLGSLWFVIPEVIGQKFTKFLHDVGESLPQLTRTSALRYFTPLRNASATSECGYANFADLPGKISCHGIVL